MSVSRTPHGVDTDKRTSQKPTSSDDSSSDSTDNIGGSSNESAHNMCCAERSIPKLTNASVAMSLPNNETVNSEPPSTISRTFKDWDRYM